MRLQERGSLTRLPNSMNILLVNYEFPPLGGGAGRGTYNLARELATAGHSVDVLTSRANGLLELDTVDGFCIHRVNSFRKGIHDSGFRGAFTFLLFAVPVFLRLGRSRNYDIIHYFFSLPTGLLHFLPGKHREVPYIVSLRGSDVPNYDAFNESLQFVHKIMLPVTRSIWRQSAQVVALSNALATTAAEVDSGVDIKVVPNGIESDLFVRNPHLKTEHRKSQPTDRVQLICVTRLIERKGVQVLLHAMQELDDSVFLTIVGEGNYKVELQLLAGRLKVDSKVRFHGYCPREDLVQLYNISDIFVLPSMAESFGMVFVEAMSCGLPVVGARVGGVPDIIKAENGILVKPDSVAELAAAISTLVKEPELREQLGLANRERAVQHYSWRGVCERYEAIYQNAIE